VFPLKLDVQHAGASSLEVHLSQQQQQQQQQQQATMVGGLGKPAIGPTFLSPKYDGCGQYLGRIMHGVWCVKYILLLRFFCFIEVHV
jgi:hypothetical protein